MKTWTLGLLCLAAACAAPDTPTPAPGVASPDDLARRDDLLARLVERLGSDERESPAVLLRNLERLIPSWNNEQRAGRSEALDNILTLEVVTHFDTLLTLFERGSHDQRVVAAWALGFSRVPENEAGVESPHPRAVEALVDSLTLADDEVARNALFALWKLGDPATPIDALTDVMLHHHDGDVRANAALALSTTLTQGTARRAVDSVDVALSDAEPKVRLHAANVARRLPDSAYVPKLQDMVVEESLPLVRASAAAALATCGTRTSGVYLLPMLESPILIESTAARKALIALFGVDRGRSVEDWRPLIERG